VIPSLATYKQRPNHRGLRKVQEASDKHGCVLPWFVTQYIKRDILRPLCKSGWLAISKPCKDCEQGGVATDPVQDLSTLLSKENRCGFYCNCGPVGHKMDDDDCGWKEKWTCDMVLCVPCYEQQITNGSDGNKRKAARKDCARVQNGSNL
jgi:hypothetical protein